MPVTHVLIALLVVVIWGLNFLFIKFSLVVISPFFLCALRFFLASIPAIFLIKRPTDVPFRKVAAYGLVVFALQFSFLFMGMAVGVAPGMASLIMQVQMFFSLIFAAMFLGERPGFWELSGALISFTGILLIAFHFDNTLSPLGFLLILGAAASWGVGNLLTKTIKTTNNMGLIVWGSFVAFPPMLLLTLLVDGPSAMLNSFEHLTWTATGSLLYIVYASTCLGYGLWNWLLKHYSVSMVVPSTLLVPIVGIVSSVVLLGEPFESWKLVAGLLVISGLGINILSSTIANFRAASPTVTEL